MSIALLMHPPFNVKFIKGGESEAVLKLDPLAALLGDFYEDWTGGPDGLLLELDASIKETHELSSQSSQHAIESGSLVSDNYTTNPQTLTIEGTVTDTPVKYLSALTSGAAGLGALAGFSGTMPPHINAWLALKALWASGEPFDVATGFDLYKSMVISRLSAPRSAMVGRQFLFTAELKQQKILTKESTTPGYDLLTTEEDLGYLTSLIPDAVTIVAAGVFFGLIIAAFAGSGD